MGLPQILIEFKTKAETLVSRSQHGVVAVLLKDNTNTTFSTVTYTKLDDVVKSHFTTANYDYITKVFMGGPSKVIVQRMASDIQMEVALNNLSMKYFNYLTFPEAIAAENEKLVAWIKKQRDQNKRTFKAVLSGVTANYEGIINFTTEGIKVGTRTYSQFEYCCRIAGILAGLPVNQSCTYYVLDEVKSITESSDPNAAINRGELILINDGTKVKIARGVNSLTTTTAEKGEDFKKIKVIDAIDIVRDDIRSTFENSYIGKVANSYDNKVLFMAAVNKYFKDLVKEGVLYDQFDHRAEIDVAATAEYLKPKMNVDDMDETAIKQANTGSFVFMTAQIRIQDAIEDLAFAISM